MQRHCLEVLHNGSEMKLVAGAGETAKTHTLKAMLDLQVRKTQARGLLRAVPEACCGRLGPFADYAA
jgi:hypothetical protein